MYKKTVAEGEELTNIYKHLLRLYSEATTDVSAVQQRHEFKKLDQEEQHIMTNCGVVVLAPQWLGGQHSMLTTVLKQ